MADSKVHVRRLEVRIERQASVEEVDRLLEVLALLRLHPLEVQRVRVQGHQVNGPLQQVPAQDLEARAALPAGQDAVPAEDEGQDALPGPPGLRLPGPQLGLAQPGPGHAQPPRLGRPEARQEVAGQRRPRGVARGQVRGPGLGGAEEPRQEAGQRGVDLRAVRGVHGHRARGAGRADDALLARAAAGAQGPLGQLPVAAQPVRLQPARPLRHGPQGEAHAQRAVVLLPALGAGQGGAEPLRDEDRALVGPPVPLVLLHRAGLQARGVLPRQN
mmetsp:Transcript_56094/g.135443  ORF Transcript_56094/g.135443 Transcript_56094/m.135443 type:complete len:273 (+) Transcript_56094:651-1469(+)